MSAVCSSSITFDDMHLLFTFSLNFSFSFTNFPSAQSLKLVVENFSLKWKEIHFLFTLLYNFQCLNNTSLGYIKQYNFHYMILGYSVDGVEYECYINLRQTKYRLVFYQSKSGRPNPHALIKVGFISLFILCEYFVSIIDGNETLHSASMIRRTMRRTITGSI